jgi:hypothetical protein
MGLNGLSAQSQQEVIVLGTLKNGHQDGGASAVFTSEQSRDTGIQDARDRFRKNRERHCHRGESNKVHIRVVDAPVGCPHCLKK